MINHKGFTLIELMVVVVIIGILAAIALPNFLSLQDRAKETEVKANAHTLQLFVEDYKVQNGIKPDGVGGGPPIVGFPNIKNPFDTAKTGINASMGYDDDFTAKNVGDAAVNIGGNIEYHSGFTAGAAYALFANGKAPNADGSGARYILKLSEGF